MIHILSAEGRAVERIPEPEKGLYPLKFLIITLAVIFGLERDVAGIQRRQRDPDTRRNRLVLDGGLPVRSHARVHQLA